MFQVRISAFNVENCCFPPNFLFHHKCGMTRKYRSKAINCLYSGFQWTADTFLQFTFSYVLFSDYWNICLLNLIKYMGLHFISSLFYFLFLIILFLFYIQMYWSTWIGGENLVLHFREFEKNFSIVTCMLMTTVKHNSRKRKQAINPYVYSFGYLPGMSHVLYKY